MTFRSFTFLLNLPETKGKSQTRQEILESVKTFISSVDAVRDTAVNITKRRVTVSSKVFVIQFSSTKTFSIAFVITEEKALESVNSIINQVSDRLNKIVGANEITEIEGVSMVTHKLGRKYKSLSQLIRMDVMKDFSQQGLKFIPTTLDISTKKVKKGKWSRFGVAARITRNILRVNLFYLYKGSFPKDIAKGSIKSSNEHMDRILKTLVKDTQ